MREPLTTRFFDSTEAIEQRRTAWRTFVDGDSDCTYHADPDTYLAMLATWRKVRPFVVEVSRGERVVGLALGVIEDTKLWLSVSVKRLVSFPARRLRLPGNDFTISLTEDRASVAREALTKIAELSSRFDWFPLPELRRGSPLLSVLQASGSRFAGLSIERTTAKDDVAYRGALVASYEEYVAKLGRKKRANMKRALRDWRAATVEFREFREPTQVAEYLEHLDQLFPKTWQAQNGGRLRPRNTQEARQALATAAEHGWWRSFMLMEDAQPVAFVHGYQYRGVFTFEELGYDQEQSSRLPGIALNHLLVERLYRDSSPDFIDMGAGENHYKHTLSSEEIPVTGHSLSAKRWVLAVLALQRVTHRAYLAGRERAVRYGWEKKLRDLLKRRGVAAASRSA